MQREQIITATRTHVHRLYLVVCANPLRRIGVYHFSRVQMFTSSSKSEIRGWNWMPRVGVKALYRRVIASPDTTVRSQFVNDVAACATAPVDHEQCI